MQRKQLRIFFLGESFFCIAVFSNYRLKPEKGFFLFKGLLLENNGIVSPGSE